MQQVTIWVTITDTTPAAIAGILNGSEDPPIRIHHSSLEGQLSEPVSVRRPPGRGQRVWEAALWARSCSAWAEPSEVPTASSRGASSPLTTAWMCWTAGVNEC